MRLTRLRIVGFKSFVEPADIPIEPGLTGIVGPNGCGKSNLVEALRWVMGESSHKNMRAAGMDEVIFSGSGGRPARNTAEVMLAIDNSARTAPAAFNDHDVLEVSRRIERQDGSTYRVNGREVRARDVQLLFADAATGARSPSLVRQGQISELIAAKPQARRRILEDAAGIAGLHARRHEAELRFKAAEDNLLRVEDVLREIDGQLDNLRKQGRQAARYRAISAEIRRLDALLHAISYAAARAEAAAAERQAAADLNMVAERAAEQTQAAKNQAIAALALPALRDMAAAAGAALQRLIHARAELNSEERRAGERAAELARQIADLGRDIERQKAVELDAAGAIERLRAEAAELGDGGGADDRAERETALAAAESALAASEAAHGALQAQASDLAARRMLLERLRREESERAARFSAERDRVLRERDAARQPISGPSPDALKDAAVTAQAALEAGQSDTSRLRAAVAEAREAEIKARAPLADAERDAQRLETEFRTLSKMFASATGDLWPSVLDGTQVEKGYEIALGAALGDDLDASVDPSAPHHWLALAGTDADAQLPEGAQSLSDRVRAPAALARRLSQIGLVARAAGAALQPRLRPGQRLVSREGDLWRWDGLVAAAEAPSGATRRLAEKNRLGEIEEQLLAARGIAATHRAAAAAAQALIRERAAAENAAIETLRQAQKALDAARERIAAAERLQASAAAKMSALEEALARVEANAREAAGRAQAATDALSALPVSSDLDARLLEARTLLAESRAVASEARAALQTLLREAEMSARRQAALQTEIASWAERAVRATTAGDDLSERLDRAGAEQRALAEAPDAFVQRRRALMSELDTAEARRRDADNRLSEGETALAQADRAARAGLDGLAAAREARAASQARSEAASAKLADLARAIADALETNPAGLLALAGHKADEPLPDAAGIEARASRLRGERDGLGGVNLRADDELGEIEGKRGALAAERDDLVEAIKRLRQAIANLNREGRERLLAAFDIVDGHFQRLFTTLFGGGTAELSLVDSDDPLEAGLEIVARPPGKKPQTMTLLSGGEQALTATALIFAVFLTNPSPICVLDEVDAPLDDANVERYCDLLQAMARDTDTRFVVITHNPITMARMDRLFGVTMAERGVSQLVSVDLQVAERLLEAS